MILPQYLEGLPDPHVTIQKLNEYVIGQDTAKKNLAVMLLVRALMRLQKNGRIPRDVEIQKTNLLLIGPTGCGKTQLMRALSEIADIPILIRDVTGITSGGYIGGKIEDIIIEYIDFVEEHLSDQYTRVSDEENSNPFYIKKALRADILLDALESGIIYLDEVDKLLDHGAKNDVSGDMVQNELLKMLEGEALSLRESRLPYPRCGLTRLDTKYITFVCGGAFSGLTDIVHERISKSSAIGFSTKLNHLNKENDTSKILAEVKTEDLIAYGFKSEFLGRLPLRATLDELSVDTMTAIITEPKNAIYKRYQEFFKLFDIKLSIEKKALQEIAHKALDLKMGARSLNKIFNDLFIDDLTNIFQLKDADLKISKKDILGRLK